MAARERRPLTTATHPWGGSGGSGGGGGGGGGAGHKRWLSVDASRDAPLRNRLQNTCHVELLIFKRNHT